MNTPPAFFNADKLRLLGQFSGKCYDCEDQHHIEMREKFQCDSWEQTEYWVRSLKERLPEGYICNLNKHATRPGGRGQPPNFTRYTWAQLYHTDHKDKGIFFTVGVGFPSECLVYKLDCQRARGTPLPQDKVECFDQYLENFDLKWQQVGYDELDACDWVSLLDISAKFFLDNLHLYHEIVDLVWSGSAPEVPAGKLQHHAPPLGLKDLPEQSRNFRGVDVDYDASQKEKSCIGSLGERLVLEMEKENLAGTEYADQVEKQKDGVGYDILSFTRKGKEKYIEVKTTESGISTPFFLTSNEVAFMELNPEQYTIYRIFEVSRKTESGKYFILENPETQILKQPIAFKCYVKSES